MRSHWLKRIRVVFGIFFLLSISATFMDFSQAVPPDITSTILYLQLVPSLVKALNIFTWTATGFVVIFVLTLLFGRVYCSAVCPLGILQDVVSYLAKKIKRQKRYKYGFIKAWPILRYTVLAFTLILFLLGNVFFITLLDPYSIFGRLVTDLVRSLVIEGNNLLVNVFQEYNYYGLKPVNSINARLPVLIVSIFFLVVITWLSFSKGRLYCNAICPVGTLLGLISKVSWLTIRIDQTTCTSCGLCVRTCKSECINIPQHNVDYSRCVACYNCLGVCPENSIRYTYKALPETRNNQGNGVDQGRRRFMAGMLVFLASFIHRGRAQEVKVVENTATVPVKRNFPTSPPGSLSIDRFNDACTACHLCVSACPTNVLQPSWMEFGLAGFLQPYMENEAGYCNFDCIRCSEVCPTGAIRPISLEEKHTLQIGIAKFIKDNCIVETERTDCGSCAEHCPTQAVHMVPFQGRLMIPEVNENICVGCGACENACPTTPWKAIYVEGNPVHQVAEKPKEEKVEKEEPTEDFPF